MNTLESALLDRASKAQGGKGHRPSMGQDVVKGRRTEIDWLNGFVVRRGAEIGIDAPRERGDHRDREAGGTARGRAAPRSRERHLSPLGTTAPFVHRPMDRSPIRALRGESLAEARQNGARRPAGAGL